MIITWAHTVGGVCYLGGSVLYFPQYSDNYMGFAASLYILGSLCYVLGAYQEGAVILTSLFSKCRRSVPTSISDNELHEYTCGDYFRLGLASVANIVGSVSYLVGSALFLPYLEGEDFIKGAASCFIFGSGAFLLGCTVGIIHATISPWASSWSSLVHVSFALGAMLFGVASIPFLWDIQDTEDQYLIFWLAALEYTVGSVFFVLGGIANQCNEGRETRARHANANVIPATSISVLNVDDEAKRNQVDIDEGNDATQGGLSLSDLEDNP